MVGKDGRMANVDCYAVKERERIIIFQKSIRDRNFILALLNFFDNRAS